MFDNDAFQAIAAARDDGFDAIQTKKPLPSEWVAARDC